jgi:hypothetical protein
MQASEVPRWFKYTFRLTHELNIGEPAKHILYTDRHIELQAKGMAQGIANARIPLSGNNVEIPLKIEPASIVHILELLEQRQASAKDQIKLRLGL